MSEKERMSVYTTIAAVLHLGNVEFEVWINLALKNKTRFLKKIYLKSIFFV